MDSAIDELRCRLTDAALRGKWKAVTEIIIDLEEHGALRERLHGYQGHVGSLSEWLKGCHDWEQEALRA